MRRTKLPALGASVLCLLAFSSSVSAQSGRTAGGTFPRPQATAPAGAAPTTSSAPSAGGDGREAAYAVRLRDLQRLLDEAKDEARRRATRETLRDSLSACAMGARLSLRFERNLSPLLVVTGLHVQVDGVPVYTRDRPSGALVGPAGVDLFGGSIPPGGHVVHTVVHLQGSGLGVFSYLRGYRFRLESTYAFTTVAGKTTFIDAAVMERGDVTTPLEQRPAVRYVETMADGAVRR
jgi:hypothetical protein